MSFFPILRDNKAISATFYCREKENGGKREQLFTYLFSDIRK